jgi:hypothetical protein
VARAAETIKQSIDVLTEAAPPSLDEFNARSSAQGLATGSGAALRFVPPDDSPEGYEVRAYQRGEIITRPDNWHDAFNADVWLEWPLTKAALNRRHVAALREQQMAGAQTRGRVRDRLTQFDECGVVIVGMPADLWQALCAHRWHEVFVARREELLATTRFVIFGHASRDILRAPHFGVCGKALLLELDADSDTATLDAALACRAASADFPGPLQPLPLLGIPGLNPANEDPAYYADTRQFRPARASPAGSSQR